MTPAVFYETTIEDVLRGVSSIVRHPEYYGSTKEWHSATLPRWNHLCRQIKYGIPPSGVESLLADLLTLTDLIDPTENMLARADAIMRPKMLDYARDEDFSENFKRTALRAGITPAQVWLVFADKHWGAVRAFCEKGRTESEDIRNRIADLVNYLLLLAGMVDEGTI